MKDKLARLTIVLTVVLGAIAFVSPQAVNAAARSSNGTGGGNWSATATWSGGVVPVAGDDVTIVAGDSVTLDTDTASLASLTVAGTLALGNNNTVRTISVTGSVTVTGSVLVNNNNASHVFLIGGNIINDGTFDLSLDGNSRCFVTFNGTSQSIIGAGATHDFANVTVNSGATVSLARNVTVSDGSVTVSGIFDLSSFTSNRTASGGTFTVSAGGLLRIGGTNGFPTNFSTLAFNPTLSPTSTVEYYGSNQTILTGDTYGNLTLSGSGTKAASAAVSLGSGAGVLTVNSGVTFSGGTSLTLGGGVSAKESINNGTITLATDLTVTGTGNKLTNNGTVTVTGNLGGSGSFFQGATGVLNNNDDSTTIGALNASASGNTVNYNRAGAQTVFPTTYHHLTPSGSGAKTLTGVSTINGNFTLAGAATATAATAMTIGGDVNIGSGTTFNAAALAHNVKGNWNNNGTFTASTSTISFSGTTNQSIGGTVSTTFSTLTIANTGSGSNVVSLAQNIIDTTLNVSSGVFDQGASFNLDSGLVTISSGATWRNLGTGTVTLSGTPTAVNNNLGGTIKFSANGTPCGDTDNILIRSNTGGAQRNWTGTGTFSLSDVDVRDQAGTAIIAVQSGTDNGNNGANWTFVGCTSGTYTWNGALLGADWQIAANWTPTRTLPAPNDILLINSGFTPIINNVPTQEIAALRITGGTSVTLKTSAANTLTISGQTGIDLEIPSSNSLTLADVNPLRINIVSGSTATIGGQIILQDSGHRLIGNAASAALLHNGADFTTEAGFTGNPFGTGGAGDGTLNSIQFENGSQYFHNAGDSPFGTAGSGPVTAFQTGSEADWLSPTGFQASGRTYANLVVGRASLAVSVSDSGTGDFKFDNLSINSTSMTSSTLTYLGSGSSTVTIQGNITSNNTGSGSFQDVTLTAGSGGIQINKPGGGALSFGNVGNGRALLLGSDTNLDSGTTLSLGRVVLMSLTADRVVTANGTLVPNVIAPGYIVGAVRKPVVPNGSFTFPVGTVLGYTPVDLTASTGGGDLSVRAVDGNHPSILANDATSLDEYWRLTLNGGSLTTDLTFTYLEGNVDGNESNYRVIKIDGSTIFNYDTTILNTSANTAKVTGISGFSDWTLGEPSGPTAVKLARFNAASHSDGVQLTWESGFEVNNLGYHLYREQNGKRTRVTPSVIAGSALTVGPGSSMTAGYSYSWFDPKGTPDSTYQLEAIDLDGSRQLAGPIYPSLTHGKASAKRRAKLFNELATASNASANPAFVKSWPAGMKVADAELTVSNSSLAAQQAIAARKAVKIQVNRSGWYRLTQAELVAAGFDSSSDARLLQLYVDGEEVPISLSSEGARLSSNDTLEFYGIALDTPTTDTRTYWLVNGSAAGKRMTARRKVKSIANDEGNTPPGFEFTLERREKMLYFSNLLNGDAENIFGAPVFADPVEQTFAVTNLASGSPSQPLLEIALQGLTEGDHQVKLQLNGTEVGTVTFTGREHPVAKFTVNAGLLHEGDNVVSLASINGDSDISLIDWVRLTYPHRYRAENNALRFTAPAGQTVRIEGFSNPNVRVIDITNPKSPTELSAVAAASAGAYAVRVQTSGSDIRTLIAFTDDLSGHPSSITANQPSSWNAATNGADMVIIAHKDFVQAIEPLANLRRSQGLSVVVVDVEDIYDEFSYGAHTPVALNAFLSWSSTHWKRVPRYLLLAGDSSWDPRNYMGQGANDLVPTKLIDTQFMETGSDDWLADFGGVGLANMAIGRLPAATVAEMNLMVSKIMSFEHERELNAPLRGAVMVADSGFESQNAQTADLLPAGTTVQTINRAQVGNDDLMRGQIVDALNQGPTIVNYYGHGSLQVWTGVGLLDADTAGNLTNANRLSLYVMMTCLNGFSHDAYDDSLAESLLKAPNGGAVAVWASSGFTDPTPQFNLDSEFYRLLFGGQPIRLGDAARNAKAAVSDQDVRRTWTLLGDPAMRIR